MEYLTTLLFYSIPYFVIWLCVYVVTSYRRSRSSPAKTPPGPYKFPVIGNLHLVGKNPHQSFAELSKRYGPLMSVRLGSKEVVVASNAAMAREILQKKDQFCCDRSVPVAVEAHDHHKFSVGWIPVSSTWRYIRKLSKEQMFAANRLDASEDLRQEKIQELLKHVENCSSSGVSVHIGGAAFITSLNLISRTLLSTDFANFDSDSSQELQEVVWGVMENVAAPNLSDYFPILRLFDPQGILRASKFYYGKVIDIFTQIINERLLVRERDQASHTDHPKGSDLLETLLDENSKKDSELSIDILKHLLADLFVAGIDTTSNTVEWAMSELLRNPKEMEKARAELRQVIGEGMSIQESDISRLPYLQAIVKEVYRIHPAGPFLIPHKANADVEIGGYLVPKDTEILVNVWASGRDEATWIQPQLFMPERFVGSEIDAKGNHFELIPFGAGRRICPGLPLAHRMVHLILATFIHNVDWELGGMKPEDLDMEEKFGLSIQRVVPLRAVPTMLSF